jgi:hypothetical protein
MNFRTTFILLALLLGVGAYVMLSPSKSPNGSAQTNNPQRLLDMSSNDVSKVVITPADGKRIVLERHTLESQATTVGPATSDWKITEPITSYADASKVSDLIDLLVSATSTAQVAIAGNAADYGLDTPQFTVDLEAGAKSTRLFIGRQVKAGNELYVQIEGKEGTAQVVGADLLDKIDTTADKLRQSKLVNADVNQANWVSIQRPSGSLELDKNAGVWQIALPTTKPTTEPADQSAVGDLVSAINNMAAAGFAGPDDSAALLIGQPQATVKIGTQSPTTQPSAQTETIEFGALDSLVGKNVWVRVTPPGDLAKGPKDSMDSILKSALDLRDRTIAQIDPATVREVRILKNIPATTQPIALPMQTHEVVLTRRPPKKIDLTVGPPLPSTQATTQPTTLALTQPATAPAAVAATAPATVWQITSTASPSDADDSKVDTLLGLFNPLKADKYLASLPAPGKPQTTYVVTITPTTGTPIDIEFSDPGDGSDSLVGVSGDLIFNCTRNLLTSLDANFAKSAATASPSSPTGATP